MPTYSPQAFPFQLTGTSNQVVWQSWTTNVTTSSAITSLNIWQNWAQGTTATGYPMVATYPNQVVYAPAQVVWGNWQNQQPIQAGYVPYPAAPQPVRVETAAERRARERAFAARQRVYERQRRREEAERAKAEKRALELLATLLTREQFAAYEAGEAFEVVGSEGGIYHITKHGVHGNVARLDPVTREKVERFCVQPQRHGWLPNADVHAIQKLHVETDENDFRRRSNITHLAAWRERAAAEVAPYVDPERIPA